MVHIFESTGIMIKDEDDGNGEDFCKVLHSMPQGDRHEDQWETIRT